MTPVPLYLHHPDRFYWHKFVPEEKLLYFQMNAVLDAGQTPLAQYIAELLSDMVDKEAEYLVIDLRHNGGGDNRHTLPLVHALIRNQKVNRPGHLFVIAGRRTLSAAMNLS